MAMEYRSRLDSDLFTDLERSYPETIQVEEGSMVRPVPMKRLKYLFDVDDDDSDYDDETVLIVGPDKRSITEVKCNNAFERIEMEFIVDLCQDRDPESWSTDEVLEILDYGRYSQVHEHFRIKTGKSATAYLTREEKIADAIVLFKESERLSKIPNLECGLGAHGAGNLEKASGALEQLSLEPEDEQNPSSQ